MQPNIESNVAEKLINAIDKALGTDAPPAAARQRIVEMIEKGRKDCVGRFLPIESAYGATPETLREVRKHMRTVPKEVLKVLAAAQARQDSIFAEMNRVAEVSAAQYRNQHLAELSQLIAEGVEASALDGFSVDEMHGDRMAKLDAMKGLLLKISREAFAVLCPILEDGAASAQKLLDAELAGEIERHVRFGIPMEQPSQFVLSIRAVREMLQARSQTPPVNWSPVRAMACNLIEI